MRADDIERLRQLFGGYFHQDWDVDASDANGVIDRFLIDHPDVHERVKLAALVEIFVEGHSNDSELEQSLGDLLWCEYVPSGSVRDWLRHVASRLRHATDDNEK